MECLKNNTFDDGELCATCGTDMEWLKEHSNRVVFHLDTDEWFCTKPCLNEYLLTCHSFKAVKLQDTNIKEERNEHEIF